MILLFLLAAAVAQDSQHDTASSRKVLGSSVVTSVSVIMDAKDTHYADALGKPVAKPQSASQVASPIDLLNPDRYEFYTFDDSGDLVKRLMTLEEIQSIIASTGDGEAETYKPEKKVNDVVNNVQNVLKEEMLSHKNTSAAQVLDTPDVSSSWSVILPAIFGNSGNPSLTADNIFGSGSEKPINSLTPDTIMLDDKVQKPMPFTRKPTTEIVKKPIKEETKKPTVFKPMVVINNNQEALKDVPTNIKTTTTKKPLLQTTDDKTKKTTTRKPILQKTTTRQPILQKTTTKQPILQIEDDDEYPNQHKLKSTTVKPITTTSKIRKTTVTVPAHSSGEPTTTTKRVYFEEFEELAQPQPETTTVKVHKTTPIATTTTVKQIIDDDEIPFVPSTKTTTKPTTTTPQYTKKPSAETLSTAGVFLMHDDDEIPSRKTTESPLNHGTTVFVIDHKTNTKIPIATKEQLVGILSSLLPQETATELLKPSSTNNFIQSVSKDESEYPKTTEVNKNDDTEIKNTALFEDDEIPSYAKPKPEVIKVTNKPNINFYATPGNSEKDKLGSYTEHSEPTSYVKIEIIQDNTPGNSFASTSYQKPEIESTTANKITSIAEKNKDETFSPEFDELDKPEYNEENKPTTEDIDKISVPEILDQLLLTSTNIYEINTELENRAQTTEDLIRTESTTQQKLPEIMTNFETTTLKKNTDEETTLKDYETTSFGKLGDTTLKDDDEDESNYKQVPILEKVETISKDQTTPLISSTTSLNREETTIFTPTLKEGATLTEKQEVEATTAKRTNLLEEQEANAPTEKQQTQKTVTTTEIPTTLSEKQETEASTIKPNIVNSIEQLIQQAVGNIAESISDTEKGDKVGALMANLNDKPMSVIQLETATAASSLFDNTKTEKEEELATAASELQTTTEEEMDFLTEAMGSILSQVVNSDKQTTTKDQEQDEQSNLDPASTTIKERITTFQTAQTSSLAKEHIPQTTFNYRGEQTTEQSNFEESEIRTTERPEVEFFTTQKYSELFDPSEIMESTKKEEEDSTKRNEATTYQVESQSIRNEGETPTTLKNEAEVQTTVRNDDETQTTLRKEAETQENPTSERNEAEELQTTRMEALTTKINEEYTTRKVQQENSEQNTKKDSEILNTEASSYIDENVSTITDDEIATQASVGKLTTIFGEDERRRKTTTLKDFDEEGIASTVKVFDDEERIATTSKFTDDDERLTTFKLPYDEESATTEALKKVPTLIAIITKPVTAPAVLKADVKKDDSPEANKWSLVSTISPDQRKPQTQEAQVQKPVKLEAGLNMGMEETTSHLDPDVKQFLGLMNELAFGFWNSVNNGMSAARSVFVSPFAATSLLAMVFLGARGATSGEMNEILKLDDMVTFNPHLILKNITESIEDLNSGVATSVILRELYSDKSKGKLLSFYKERAKQFYDGHVEEVGFKEVGDVVRRRTNLMVKRLTQGKVQEFIKDSSIKVKAPLAGVSVSIFQTDCSAASTEGRDGELYFVVLPSIRQRRLIPIPAAVWKSGFLAGYEPTLDATAVAIGNKTQTVSTIFVIPGQQGISAPGDGLARLERQLMTKPSAWTSLLKSLIPRPGLEVQIPRFSHRSVINASVALQRMGMKDLFDSQKADLRGLNGVANDLYLSDILQINSFATCGEGPIGDTHHSEIYPATADRTYRRSKKLHSYRDVELLEEPRDYQRAFHDPLHDPTLYSLPLPLRPRQARLPEPAPRLRFDRPFLYFVRHNPTGLILHMGRFNPRLLP